MKNKTYKKIDPPPASMVPKMSHYFSIIPSPSNTMNFLSNPLISIHIQNEITPAYDNTTFTTYIIIKNIYLWVHQIITYAHNKYLITDSQLYNNIVTYDDTYTTKKVIYNISVHNTKYTSTYTKKPRYISSSFNNTISYIQLSLLPKHTYTSFNKEQYPPYDILHSTNDVIYLQYNKNLDLNLVPLKKTKQHPFSLLTKSFLKNIIKTY